MIGFYSDVLTSYIYRASVTQSVLTDGVTFALRTIQSNAEFLCTHTIKLSISLCLQTK